METIIVKSLNEYPSAKGSMLKLNINGNRDVTIAAWKQQEIDFVKKDVGVGGNFQADVVQNGNFTNIENIDFASANKATGNDIATEKVDDAGVEKFEEVSRIVPREPKRPNRELLRGEEGYIEPKTTGREIPNVSEGDYLEADAFSVNAKSSVKLKMMAKGMAWEIKVVSGEAMLIPEMVQTAITSHRALCEEFPAPVKENE